MASRLIKEIVKGFLKKSRRIIPLKGVDIEISKIVARDIFNTVKKYYEEQVPLKRGCTVEDIMKAIYYIIDHKTQVLVTYLLDYNF